jgi:hypothetical protein
VTASPTAWEGARPPAARRAAQLARTRGLRHVVGVAGREASYRIAAKRIELAVASAARTKRRLLVGPFVGEVGFELLYWIPLVRALLERHGVDPDRVTVLTRGGAGAWYADFAGGAVEIFDLLPSDEFVRRVAERRAAVGDLNQLTVEQLDRHLLARAPEKKGPATGVDPLLMYAGLRSDHAGWRSVDALARRARYRLLAEAEAAVPEDLAAGYVAVKAYDSDCLPLDTAACARLDAIVATIAASAPVVVLATGRLDDHSTWVPASGKARIVAIDDPRSNLAVQAEIVRRARALVTNAGGFSYLGAFTGTPTLALYERASFNPVHLDVLRRSLPGCRYLSAQLADTAALDGFLRREAA